MKTKPDRVNLISNAMQKARSLYPGHNLGILSSVGGSWASDDRDWVCPHCSGRERLVVSCDRGVVDNFCVGCTEGQQLNLFQ